MGAVYMECSAKERIGIDDIFDSAIVLATGEEEDGENLGPDGSSKGGQSKGRRKRVRKACKIL
jgi:Ras family protein A